jgi:hypothetical protein
MVVRSLLLVFAPGALAMDPDMKEITKTFLLLLLQHKEVIVSYWLWLVCDSNYCSYF